MATNKSKERKQKELVQLGLRARPLQDQLDMAVKEIAVGATRIADLQAMLRCNSQDRQKEVQQVKAELALRVDVNSVLVIKANELQQQVFDMKETIDWQNAKIAELTPNAAEERDVRKLRKAIHNQREAHSKLLTELHRVKAQLRKERLEDATPVAEHVLERLGISQ